MANEELLIFVHLLLEKKKSKDEISETLLKKGWTRNEIHHAIALASGEEAPTPHKELPRHSKWDSFDYIFLYISFSTLCISLLTALNIIIDQNLISSSPDTESYAWIISYFIPITLQTSLVMLFISYPIFSVIMKLKLITFAPESTAL